MTDTCNATERVASKLKICNLPMNHAARKHDSGDHEWPVESSSYAGEEKKEVRHEF